jgi:hypothetical protein
MGAWPLAAREQYVIAVAGIYSGLYNRYWAHPRWL